MPLRVTGGRLRGQRLAPLKGMRIRPTSDRVREAIFNIIGQDLADLRVLDLFAGAGSLGIEALSRGASEALFVDRSPEALGLVRKNLGLCGLEKQAVVLKRDLRKGLPAASAFFESPFDLVFLDPPYERGLLPPLLKELGGCKVLVPGALVIAETSKGEDLSTSFGRLQAVGVRLYGDTKISIFSCELKT